MREAEIGRIELSGQIRQESFQDSISMEKKLGVVVPACHPSDGGSLKMVGLRSRLAWAKSEALIPK
jgi:hypothetical protein